MGPGREPCSNRIPEGPSLEYKVALTLGPQSERIEALKDLTGMGNAGAEPSSTESRRILRTKGFRLGFNLSRAEALLRPRGHNSVFGAPAAPHGSQDSGGNPEDSCW